MFSVPDVSNLSSTEAQKVLSIAGFNVKLEGSGSVVVDQTPAAFSKIESGETVLLTMGNPEMDADTVIVPDLTGLRMRESAELLAAMGLQSKTAGSGTTAAEQFPVPGTKVKKGDIITVTFSNSSASGGEDEETIETLNQDG